MGKFGGSGGQCFHGDGDAGQDGPADIGAVTGYAIESYGRSEVDDDEIAGILRPGGNGVDKPVRSDFLRCVRFNFYDAADIFFRDNQNRMA